MATDARRTRFNALANAAGLTDTTGAVTGVLNHEQVEELHRMATAAGCTLAIATPATAGDQVVLAPIASQGNTITIQATVPGHAQTTGLVSVAVADAGGDTLAVTYSAGVLAISLANTTDSKNTLTLIKAAIDAAVTSTTGAGLSTFITGTGSTQMVHGGTNTLVATAAGGTAGTSLKSSTAGVGTFTVAPL
jgi:hypothetical protein